MTKISPASATAQERARRTNGQFGTQDHPEAQQVDLGGKQIALWMPPDWTSERDVAYLLSQPEPFEQDDYERWEKAVESRETTKVFRWWQMEDRTEREQEQVAAAVAEADSRAKVRYRKTPVYPSGLVVGGGGGKHLGSGVFGWRCPNCGKLFTDFGSSGMSLYRHRVDEHNWSPPPLLPRSNRSL